MTLRLLVPLFCFMFLMSASNAAALSAADFMPPASADNAQEQAAAMRVERPDQVKPEKGIDGKKAISASTAKDAINSALIQVRNDGCEQIKFPSGFGWVASGTAVYGVTQNPVANLIAQRQAYQVAFLNAKKNLAQALNGLSSIGRDQLAQEFKTVVTDTDTLSNMRQNVGDNINELVHGILRGYVLYNVNDAQAGDQGAVTVSIVTTPRTMAQGVRVNENGINAESVQAALQGVLNEISNGLLPPVGGKFISVPQTGELAFVGFGSAVIPDNPSQAAHAKLMLDAEKIARMRARSALCGIILGDDVSSMSSLDTSTKTISDQFREVQKQDNSGSDDQGAIQKLDKQRNTFLSEQLSGEQISSLRSGVLPPGIKMRTYLNKDKTLAEAVAVYLPSLSAEAAKSAEEMSKSDPLNEKGGQLPPRGPSGQVMRDADL